MMPQGHGRHGKDTAKAQHGHGKTATASQALGKGTAQIQQRHAKTSENHGIPRSGRDMTAAQQSHGKCMPKTRIMAMTQQRHGKGTWQKHERNRGKTLPVHGRQRHGNMENKRHKRGQDTATSGKGHGKAVAKGTEKARQRDGSNIEAALHTHG